jgi:protoporphyrinogen/coproporphyrinogen III oxidase
MANQEQVVVIGGGISGLACAVRLRQLGTPVILLESSERAGGLIGTVETNGFLFETGPQSFQGTETLLALIRELEIEGELRKADSRAPRWVLRRGRLQKVPMSPQAVLTSSLLGVGARWKVVSEAFGKTQAPDEDESVAQFVRRKFGHEILEYLVSPFVSGVYAGDPEKLSLRAAFPTLEEWERQYGSILRGAMKSRPPKTVTSGPPSLCSFRRGMATLTDAMAAKLGDELRSGATAGEITRAGGEGRASYQIRVTERGRETALTTCAVVVATPAYVASHLLEPISPELAKTLSGIEYASMAVIASTYYKQQIGTPLDGFGVLIPRSEKHRTLGIVWNSSLFGDRAPEGQVVLTSFIGGATDPEILEESQERIEAIVQVENARILGITGQPLASAVWKHPKALPQYNLGHGYTVQAVREAQSATPGLYFAGNYLEGPSIGKCVEKGFETAEAACRYLQQIR